MADDLATQIVDSISRNFKGTHDHRAAHAKGFCVSGLFTATPEAAALTRAAHLRGNPVAVTVRFSNGSGSLESADHHVDGRGMAVKFHLPGGEAADIVSITQRTFFVRTPEDFLEFTDARKPDPETGRPDPNAIGDFLIRHPEAESAFTEVLSTSPPRSFATTAYNALHAYRWLDGEGGSRWVRYHWVPEAGVATIERDQAKALGRDYLRAEMEERLAREPVVFTLQVSIAEQGDDPDDPTAEWRSDRRRVTVGRLELS
ncbi:MAG: catalase, partial [Candidatus Dormibacteraeota bacterium]|nr:catalase [Candidatus Dormibacteraeota bacterium]